MKVRAWQTLWVIAVIGLAGCAGSGGPTRAVTKPEAGVPAEEAARQPEADVPDKTESAEEPLVNRLKWSTASEVDNFGFDIYRGTSEDGPFERITTRPIQGAGSEEEGGN